MFKNPPESTVPITEQEHIKELESEYLMRYSHDHSQKIIISSLFVFRMRALQWYLYEDDLKAGDTGEAALIAAEKEEQVHQQNLNVRNSYI